ncbi:Grx4 family monothiol glutaredoxin [Cyphellophora europaea CBS 101466]|uniref:Grx4 family monothiol glutaredoxin n=1 Tax=Cyphellophora europaea (strain CBS 101466) TaxID=1220924 RepID=W2S447_CYPE1|nr:Grx4 family monothiol glutaredoxin [Cyphellophora europaea CBS 101466]ETN42739.1 Grx4 family monothiol glutaredoxin [Cyphellophora europaea CBS 101466]
MPVLTEVTSDTQFSSLIQYANPTTLLILYFHTPWAAPCAQMKTILSTLASTYPSESPLTFLSINAEDLPDISESYDVTAVPFLVLQRDGKTLETVSGSDATKVRAAVERHAGPATGAGVGAVGGAKAAIPPALAADPSVAPQKAVGEAQANGVAGASGGVTKDLSGYAPKEGQAPADAGAGSKEELNTRLENLVKAAPVMLFMKGTPSAPQCGFSRQLVGLLRENQVKYGFFNILADDDVRQGLKEFSDWPTFPQLYTNGELVGGLDIVKEELETDPDFFKEFAAAKAPATAAA